MLFARIMILSPCQQCLYFSWELQEETSHDNYNEPLVFSYSAKRRVRAANDGA